MSKSETFRRVLPQIAACILASNGAFVAGTNIGWSSQSQGHLLSKAEYPFEVSAVEFSWISSLLTLGAALGAPLSSLLVNRIGRKKSILATFIPFIAGWVLIICAQNVVMMCIGRFVLGMCCGGFMVVVPIYIGEVAQKEIRGMLGSFLQLFIVIGVEFSYILGAVLKVTYVSLVLLCFPLLLAILFLWMPETPAYLVATGHIDNAKKNMRFLYGKSFDVEAEVTHLQHEAESRQLISFDLIKTEFQRFVVWYALIIAIGLQIFRQFSGVNAVIFYVTDIFKKAVTEDSLLKPSHSTSIVGAIQIVSNMIAMGVVDKTGRKILLIISGSVMALCTFLLGIYFFLAKKGQLLPPYVPLILICTYIALYCFGFGPVTWIIIGEIFTPASREIGCGIAVFFNWILAFAVTRMYQLFANSVGVAGTFWIFSSVTTVGVIFVFLVIIETKGLSLSEITRKLEERNKTAKAVYKDNYVTDDVEKDN